MRRLFFSFIALIGLLFAVPARAAEDIAQSLARLPGLTFEEKTSPSDQARGFRRFALTLEQPIDHAHPKLGSFRQRLVLFHRSYDEPMVLQTSGYNIFGQAWTRLASTFGTNQIQVEHRYFGQSVPENSDWKFLTVRQSADDFHHVVETFKKLYPGRWVNTGASKGGMTSVFFRRYYPGDVDGTVADVAPFSYSLADERYIAFVAQAGGPAYADCRQKLADLQVALLRRSGEVMPLISGGSYDEVGDKLISYEAAAVEMPFLFWQYNDPADPQWGCPGVPAADSPAVDLANFFRVANSPTNYNDASLKVFRPYYYQSAAELGAPGADLSHLRGLLRYPYVIDPFLPKGAKPRYSSETLLDMRSWAAQEAKGLMFVYGEFDPWTAGAFPALKGGAENYQYVMPGGNHGANFRSLPEKEKSEAIAVLSRWLNKAPVQEPASISAVALEQDDSLEAVELRSLRPFR